MRENTIGKEDMVKVSYERIPSFEEWLFDSGKKDDLGLKMLITYSVLRIKHNGVIDAAFNTVKHAFVKKLFETGSDPISIEFMGQNDPEMMAREITSILKTQQGMRLDQYAGVIMQRLQDVYGELVTWKSKSLWQYIKWVFKRKKEA